MGCNNSRNIQVQPVSKTPRPNSGKWTAEMDKNEKNTSSSKRGTPVKQTKVQPVEPLEHMELDSDVEIEKAVLPDQIISGQEQIDMKKGTKKKKRGLSSLASLRRDGSRPNSATSNNSQRGGSATSKNSKHSTDSGLEEDYAHVITEYSDESKIRALGEEFGSREDLDLSLSGTACPRRTSAKDKARLEENVVMAALRDEGLIARPKSRAAGGMSFDIIMAGPDPDALKKPPARLAKLERRKKKTELTEDQIKAKLEKAERRRKKKEQEKLERIQTTTQKSDILHALDSFEQKIKEKEQTTSEKIDSVTENREKKLKELRDKLKAKEEHAEKVRRRKKLLPMMPHPESSQAAEMEQLS
ncbi:DNA ligase 1 [Lingula anatina]|uniref:DNA ligase 1 n=1 Tax=Lingula anatina TaxID=7574 RepID=A0A1S3J3J2_LINAN|nr:DNA ligase 1 [Lingula anatina]|eukprot:XP_013404970.1 DNA ligase 1 [Lingula anatina]